MDDHHMMSNEDRLIYMADQIARNFAAQGHDHAVLATADHIKSFWDPRMKQQIARIAAEEPHRLSPDVARAVAALHKAPPPPQTPATVLSEAGHSDAG